MPATSFVRMDRMSLLYARLQRSVYGSSEDIRASWDGGHDGDDGREKESPEDDLSEASQREAVEVYTSWNPPTIHIVEPTEQETKALLRGLLDAKDPCRPWEVRSSSPRSSPELTFITDSIIEHIMTCRAEHLRRTPKPEVDGLCCPICEGILRYPVTATCGHTFCRLCCFGHSCCTVCGQRFPSVSPSADEAAISSTVPFPSAGVVNPSSSSTVTSAAFSVPTSRRLLSEVDSEEGVLEAPSGGGFEPDILIRRLVERWWGSELKATDLQEEAQRHLEAYSLDEALRCCNQSLEHVPNSAKGLQLRSEVLHRLQHFQSALADADRALECLPTSPKAHYCRALSLSALGKYEEAVMARCMSIFLDRESHVVMSGVKTELMKDLKRFLQESTDGHGRSDEQVDPLGSLFDHSYDLIAGCRKRRHRGDTLPPQRRKAKKQFLTLRQGDFDEDHSDYGADVYLTSGLLFDYIDDPFSEESLLEPARVRERQHRSHHRRRWKSGGHLLESDLGLERHLRDHHYHQAKEQQRQQQLHLQEEQQQAQQLGDSTIPMANQRLKALLERLEGELKSSRWMDTTPVRLHVNPALIEPSDFDCVLCCRTLWRPVVTPCGHTYCWVCLDRCMDYSSSCPLCMAPLVEQFRHHLPGGGTEAASSGTSGATSTNLISLAKRKMTRFVDLAMQRFIPEAYERRQQQEQDREPTVPVFICTTAFPSVPCPLFVYEQRYRLMVRRAIESGERRFGIALPAQNGRQRYVEYGTMLDIRDCVQLGDGCSILSTVGGRRFRVLTRHERDGYDTAHVEFFEDEKIGAGETGADERLQLVRDLHEKVLLKAIDWHQSLPEGIRGEIFKSFGKMPDLEENWESVTDGPAWAWWIIAILPLNDKLKVDILSTTSLKKRLRAIDKTLDLESAQQKRQRSVCVMAGASSTCCEGLSSTQQCQAIDCCLRERTTSSVHNHHHHHHHDSDRQSESTQHHHLHHHHHHHLSSSADDYLL